MYRTYVETKTKTKTVVAVALVTLAVGGAAMAAVISSPKLMQIIRPGSNISITPAKPTPDSIPAPAPPPTWTYDNVCFKLLWQPNYGTAKQKELCQANHERENCAGSAVRDNQNYTCVTDLKKGEFCYLGSLNDASNKKNTYCPIGCNNGACSSANTIIIRPASCTDTDAGVDYLKLGKVQIRSNNNPSLNSVLGYTDYCVDAKNLMEYSCVKKTDAKGVVDYDLGKTPFNCDLADHKVCKDGACVVAPTPIPPPPPRPRPTPISY